MLSSDEGLSIAALSDLRDHGITQHADAADFHFCDIAWPHEELWAALDTHACGCPRNDHVAREQWQHGGDVRDLLWNGRDHEIGRGALDDLPIQPRFQREARWIGNIIRGHQPGAKCTRPSKTLTRKELAGVTLPIAHTAFIVAGVAGHVFQSTIRWNVPAWLADDDRKLTFIVEFPGNGRFHKRL